jgi:hypothetical protein
MGLSVVPMFGIEQVTIHLSGHIEGVACLHENFVDLPLTTDKNEYRSTGLVELIIGEVSLNDINLNVISNFRI